MAIEGPRARLSALPKWVGGATMEPTVAAPFLVAGTALAVVAVRLWMAWSIPTPWIMIDELTYSELAKSLAHEGRFLSRGEPLALISLVYPALIAPAWLTSSVEDAYALAKAINVIVMTSAAVPLYFWARRVVPGPQAVLATALALLLPSFLFTGMLMTENAFLPAFLLAAFAIALALERPTPMREVAALAAIALASAVRLQGLILFLVLPSAILLKAFLDSAASTGPGGRARFLLREVARYRISGSAALLASTTWLIVSVAGEPPLALPTYEVVLRADYSLIEGSQWVLYHWAEFALSVGVIPFCASIVLVGLALRGKGATTSAERAFLAVTVAVVWWLLLEVGLFASKFSLRIEERNMFYAAPLLLLALVLWLARGKPRPALLTALAALTPAALSLALPLERLLNISILSDTFALIPFWRPSTGALFGGHETVRWTILGAGLLGGALFALTPRRVASLGLSAAMAAFLAFSSHAVFLEVRDYARALGEASGIEDDVSWVDRAIAADSEAAFFFTSNLSPHLLWQMEFWNKSVGEVYNLGLREPSGLPEIDAAVDYRTGRIEPAAGVPGRAGPTYLIADNDYEPVGTVVADEGPWSLYRIEPPLRLAKFVEGVFQDGWIGADAAYTQYATPGGQPGTLLLNISRTGPGAPDVPVRVRIEMGEVVGDQGRLEIPEVTAVRTWVIDGFGQRGFAIPTPPPPFRAEIHVEPTFSPADAGFADTRELGGQVWFLFVPR